jgi:hypothetical protein
LGTIDEHVIGTIGTSKTKYKMIFTKETGILIQNHHHHHQQQQQNQEQHKNNNIILKEWHWDKNVIHSKEQQQIVSIELNEALVFTYQNRFDMKMVFFPCPNIKIFFEMGEKLKRTDTYLEHACKIKKGPKIGHLEIHLPPQSRALTSPKLKQPVLQTTTTMIKPHSSCTMSTKEETMDFFHKHLEIKKIVQELEDSQRKQRQVEPSLDKKWKQEALLKSLQEIPIIEKTGFEIEETKKKINDMDMVFSLKNVNDTSQTLKRLKNQQTGQWLGNSQIRQQLLKENPFLKRSKCLNDASGRYSRELSTTTSTSTTTSHITHGSNPLEIVSGLNLDFFLKEKCDQNQLIIVACLRDDDPLSRKMEKILEQIHAILIQQQQQHSSSSSSPHSLPFAASNNYNNYRLVKCNLAESKALSEKYRIVAVPTFLIFYHTKLVQVTSWGGIGTLRSMIHGGTFLPFVLLIEKNFQQQILIEKILKKEKFQWNLAINGEQAIGHFTMTRPHDSTSASTSASTSTRMSDAGGGRYGGYGMVILSDSMEEKELHSLIRFLRPKEQGARIEDHPMVCAIVVSKPLIEVQFSTTMCIECKKNQGKRIRSADNEIVSSSIPFARALACAHCGIIMMTKKKTEDKISSSIVPPILEEIGDFFIYKHIKATTLHRLTERWAAINRTSTSNTNSSSIHTSSSITSMKSHKGLTVPSFFQEMEWYLNQAKSGIFLPNNYIPEIALSATDTILHGTIGAIAKSSMITTTKFNT